MTLRPEREIAAIVETIQAVTLPTEPDPEPSKRSLFWMPAEMQRAFRLAQNSRFDKLTEMVRALAVVTKTPEWVARMALDAVILPGNEADLDDSENDRPAFELALLAMGLNPATVTWSAAIRH